MSKRFVEVSVRVDTLDAAVALARSLDGGDGVQEIAIDNGEGYGMRKCAEEGCDAVLVYPDEGDVCETHTCQACGVSVGSLSAFPIAWRDGHGIVWTDSTATSCQTCYAAVMNSISADAMLRVQERRRRMVPA